MNTKKENIKDPEYRKWCCWTLDEEEILHVVSEVFNLKNPKGLVTDDEMEMIVEDFTDRISAMYEEWEENLKEIVKENLKEHFK